MEPAKPTGAPRSFKVMSKTSTSVKLSWNLPDKWKRNGKIIGYELSYRLVGSSDKKNVEKLDDKTEFEVRGLKKFTPYQFWILAKTEKGNGPATMLKETTKEDGKII